MSTQIPVPMELDMVDPSNANAYWTRQDNGAGFNGVYRFINGVHPHSKMVFKCQIPDTLAAPALWNVAIYHSNQQAAGAVLVRAEANVLGSGDTPGVRTVIVPNQLVGVGPSGDVNRTLLSSTNFDSLLTLTAGEILRLEFMRAPNGASGDTAGANWDLVIPPVLMCNVN